MNRYRDQTTAPQSVGQRPGDCALGRAQLRVVFWPAEDPLPEPRLLGESDVRIGRDVRGAGDLELADLNASRLHARVCWDQHAGGHRLGDAGSSNGTFVNGECVETYLLQPGDVVRIGKSLLLYEVGDTMAETRTLASRVARSDCNVLLLGETGVGKEVLARYMHAQSERKGAFVAVNCAALPSDLVESELFGHARGAFSGAERARSGLFVAADGGTLLLDEVGDLPLEQQPVLLRAIEERKLRPVGADRDVPVNVHIIAATNVDLEEAVKAGRFRADLLARLAQLTLHVPPLRERRGDILPLLQVFLREADRPVPVTAKAAEALLLWSWPQNVRELRTLVGAFAVAAPPDAELDVEFLSQQKPRLVSRTSSVPPPPGQPNGIGVQREQLKALLREHHGNVAAVARTLGRPRSHVYRWITRFGLSPSDFRS